MKTAMNRRRWLVVLMALVLVGAACDNGSDDEGSPDEPTTSSSTSTTLSEAEQNEALCDFAASGAERVEPEGVPLVVTDVSVDVVRIGCVETVSFSLRLREGEESSLGYDVGIDEPPFVATNDETIEVEGDTFVRITLLNAMTLDENFEPAYQGPDEIRPDGALFIVEVEKITDFEGVSEWVVGLDGEHSFAVSQDGTEGEFVVAIGPGPT